MFRVLIADDDYEDRELLKLEIQKALGKKAVEIRFHEASNIKDAMKMLKNQPFDLMTLDIQFDRMNEGIDALPDIFEGHPTLNVIVISGKLNKSEVFERLFRFTKDNLLKGKRWARHFDILDKKDDKTEALNRAYSFVFRQKDVTDKIRDLFLLAESYMDKGEMDKCIEVYQKIQAIAPGESESGENVNIFKGASAERAVEYLRKGETVVAALLLGYHVETRLRALTRKLLGRSIPGLQDSLKELERSRRITPYKKSLFQHVLRLRNKAIHHPMTVSEADFDTAFKNLKLIEADF
ncbi:MAG: response regulator [Thermodesulfovibrionales bacterium]|nr:response regulator [Thermodesulfovibrionales bacterium]